MEDTRFRELTEPSADGMGYVFKGPSGPAGTSLLMKRCRYLLENAAAGEGMLIIVGNRSKLNEWDRELLHSYSVEPRLCTFRGFVRQELDVFYPLAAAKCNGLAHTEIRPAFLDRDAAVNLVSKVIQHRREKDGIFSSLSSTSEKIASDILGSLDAAAMAGIPYNETFDRLYSSLEIKNEDRRKIYQDASGIALAYRNKCLELGVLDTAASIELYCGFILKDGNYKALLKSDIRYLVADDIQYWDEALLLTAELLLPGLRSFAFGFDPEACNDCTNRLRRNMMIEDRLLSRCKFVSINENKNESAVNSFSGILYDAIASGKISKVEKGLLIERHPSTELRSEMLELLGKRVCELIDVDGVKPSEIAVLSTYADIVTELVLTGMLRSRGHGLSNLAARDKAYDSRLCRALLVFAGLCHPDLGIYPSRDDIRLLSEMLFQLDSPRASMLAGKTCNSIPFIALPGIDWQGLAKILDEDRLKKYLYVTAWIEDYKNAPEADMEVFLQKAFLEVFSGLANSETEVIKARQLINRAGDFCDSVSRFGRNSGRDFLSSAGYGINVGKGAEHMMGGPEEENVILATPSAYLESGLTSRVTVICGLSSNNWSPARVRELVNPNVLCAAWKAGGIYTAAHEDSDRRLYLADTMRAVVQNCSERLITFESLLSANGYENDGILPEIFDSIL